MRFGLLPREWLPPTPFQLHAVIGLGNFCLPLFLNFTLPGPPNRTPSQAPAPWIGGLAACGFCLRGHSCIYESGPPSSGLDLMVSSMTSSRTSRIYAGHSTAPMSITTGCPVSIGEVTNSAGTADD